jgi:hypothetical protein
VWPYLRWLTGTKNIAGYHGHDRIAHASIVAIALHHERWPHFLPRIVGGKVNNDYIAALHRLYFW